MQWNGLAFLVVTLYDLDRRVSTFGALECTACIRLLAFLSLRLRFGSRWSLETWTQFRDRLRSLHSWL